VQTGVAVLINVTEEIETLGSILTKRDAACGGKVYENRHCNDCKCTTRRRRGAAQAERVARFAHQQRELRRHQLDGDCRLARRRRHDYSRARMSPRTLALRVDCV